MEVRESTKRELIAELIVLYPFLEEQKATDIVENMLEYRIYVLENLDKLEV